MAEEAKDEQVKHDFKFNAELNNEEVTLTCSDDAQNKNYKCVLTKNDYQNINDEFDKMKKAIEGGNTQIIAPEQDDGPLG